MRTDLSLLCAFLSTLALTLEAHAQVSVSDAWVRATVAQQKGTGAFMRIVSAKDAKLVEVKSPVAKVAEVHEMSMVDNVMRMRPVAALALPAGKVVELKPNGYHVMLMELTEQIKVGDLIPITLTIEDKDSKREVVEIKAPARPLNATGPATHHKH
jgi:copper(I)-binding protein